MPDIDEIRELLNMPFVSATDDDVIEKGKPFVANIFIMVPQDISAIVGKNMINIGIVPAGRFELEGDGKGTVAKRLTENLEQIRSSLVWIEPGDSWGRNPDLSTVLTNFIFTVNGRQYYVDDDIKTVRKRSDAYLTAVRNPKVMIPGFGTGFLMMDGWAVSDFGHHTNYKLEDGFTDWQFPAIEWTEVEGIRSPFSTEVHAFVRNTTTEEGDAIVKVMVPDSFERDSGVFTRYRPIYVQNDAGKQINYLAGFGWTVMKSRFDSRQDREINSEDVWFTVENAGSGRYILKNYTEPGVTARVDYWKSEVLRVSYYKDDHAYTVPVLNLSVLEIGMEILGGEKILTFYMSRPDHVNRPSLITAYDADMNAVLYSSNDHDIVVNDVSPSGVISNFKLLDMDGNEVDKPEYRMAILGDRTGQPNGIKRMTMLDLSGAQQYLRKMGDITDRTEDVVVDGLMLNEQEQIMTGQMLGDDVVRKITADLMPGLVPQSIDVETDVASMMYTYGSLNMMSLRFDVPDDKRLKEIEDEYRNIGKQMDQKAKTRADAILKWRTGAYRDAQAYAKKKFGLVANDGVSGTTMVNLDDLEKGADTITIEGV